ncbi:MAG TPA: hypothetical protein VJ716_05105 [Gaiellaceae bacterium]|nr:hypothetical protein [Gaiellaceae bacterium]
MSTPPDDQLALDAAAEDARRIAGDAYYRGCLVHHPGRVTLYLAHAPQAVLDFAQFGPTPDGYVQVGILSPFVAAAQARLDAVYGCGVMRAFKTERVVALGAAAARSARAARSTAARTAASSTA